MTHRLDQPLRFPPDFLWGTATAGHQVEGNNVHSDWWAWEQQGLIKDGTRSGRACDYWNRYAEDHALMQAHGHNIFRLGVEWARIEPAPGEIDRAAVAHYRSILEDLHSRKIAICLTLNHWVLPQWFAAGGGWLAADALKRWESFVRLIARELGDLVDLWVTLNEPMVPVLAGYLAGYFPPCRRAPLQSARVFRRLLEAHALAYHVVHELVPRSPTGGGTMVGFAGAYQLVEPFHDSGMARNLERPLAAIIARVSFGAWDLGIMNGTVAAPFGVGQRIDGLRGSVDWVGVNYYTRISALVGRGSLSNVQSGGFNAPPGIELNQMGWQNYPPGFYEVLMDAQRNFGRPIYVTENGCADPGDEMRRRYLVSHWAQMHRAMRDGCDLRGYMLWSFTDNFEWREGFAKKLGIIAMDHADPELKRVPRDSAFLYRDVIAAGALTQEIVDKYAPGGLNGWGA